MSSVHSIPEYHVWKQMRQRCQNKGHKQYHDYGGRGITVCQRWNDSFASFLADMGRRPAGRYSIERRDNNGAYENANCYWATPEQQGGNKRNNRMFTLNGKTLCLRAWSRELGIPYKTLYSRIVYGMTESQILRKVRYKPGPT